MYCCRFGEMNPVTRIHSHIWSTKRISIAVYFIIKLSQLQAAKSYDSHRLIYRAIGREPRIPRHWGHGVVLERWIVEKKRRHSINSLSSLLLPSYFHARSTSLFYIFRETRVEREKRFIEISKRPRSHDPINRKTGFPYSNSPPPLVLPWFFLSFHDLPPPHDHWIVSMNQPNIYIYILDLRGWFNRYDRAFLLEVRSTKKKMREDAVPLSERAPVFSPDVTNFVADERVFLDSLLRRERGGSRV